MTDRCRCVVPFCRHTTGRFPADVEWICGQHWRLVDRSRKRWLARMRCGVHMGVERDRYLWAFGYHWRRAKSQAIERAAGITA